MYLNNMLYMATNGRPIYMLPQMATRHGLITGATGTGKTVTVKVLAEAFSDAGVPVFLSDIKGDLAGMSIPGQLTEDMQNRINRFGLNQCGWQFSSFPTVYWDVFAKKGIPVRATVSEMGPLLLSRLMDLSAAQEGVLNIIFKIADDQGLLLLDLKDLRAVVQAVGDHAADYKTVYGNIATSSIGAIQRGLLKLETQGADRFFGEPALDIMDWIRCDQFGRGMINVLNCEALFQKPDLYTAYLLWMLSELYETLPEAGDLDKPKMVFFFDEAHLLFKLKSKELMDKVEQVIRLIRSKGVGVFFITQNPADVPDTVLSQLGNKIQHALRAYTPSEQKAVRAAAQSFVVNPEFKTEEVIPQLGKGEALVSFLDEKGAPSMVQRAFILPPQSMMGTIDEGLLGSMIYASDMFPKYSQAIDRQSAYELLNGIMPMGTTLQYASYPEATASAAYMQQSFRQNTEGPWICPVCSAPNTGNFCGNCGNPRPQAEAPQTDMGQMFGQMPGYQEPSDPYAGRPMTNYITSTPQQTGYQQPEQGMYAQPAYPQQNYGQQPAYPQQFYSQQPAYPQQPIGSTMYTGPSLVQAVQAQQMSQLAQTQTVTQAELDKMQKEAVKQAKAELKAEQEAAKAAQKKESDFSKSAKSIATSGARTAVNYLVRGALGTLLKK